VTFLLARRRGFEARNQWTIAATPDRAQQID
jgi:hypothetical protein